MKNALTILALCSLLGSAFTRGTVQAQAGRGNGSSQERLNSAADAILRLKSAQCMLTREGAPAFLDEKAGVTFTAAISGWEQSANPVRIHVTEPAGNGWLIELIAVNEPVDIPTPKIAEPSEL
jgi:hypothetical protein